MGEVFRAMLLQERFPQLHRVLLDEFGKVGLQPYDVLAQVVESENADEGRDGDSVTLRLSYGEAFDKHTDLEYRPLTANEGDVVAFFHECATAAHEALRDEYRKSMGQGAP